MKFYFKIQRFTTSDESINHIPILLIDKLIKNKPKDYEKTLSGFLNKVYTDENFKVLTMLQDEKFLNRILKLD